MARAIAEHLTPQEGSSRVMLLSRDLTPTRYPTRSQDGSLLTYQSLRDGNMELFVASADLSQQRRLTFNDIDESHPTLSKDNTSILFTEGASETHRTDVVIMQLDGSGRRILTAEPNVFGAVPTLSRSNVHIAYTEWMDEGAGAFSLPRIVVLDVISGEKRYITPANRESWRPVFSSDGSHAFYISKSPGNRFDLYAFDFSTGLERQLTTTPFDEWDPQVSANGRYLVYAAKQSGNWDLFVMDLASGQSRQLTDTKGDEWDPSFGPDDATILFAGRFGVLETIYEMPFVGW
jgi:Tol biopolymer transport system component